MKFLSYLIMMFFTLYVIVLSLCMLIRDYTQWKEEENKKDGYDFFDRHQIVTFILLAIISFDFSLIINLLRE